jgi:hypothetical protein
VATMVRTLHHMAEPVRAIGEVGGVMSPGGVFILEFANKRNLKALLRWALRRQAWTPFDRSAVEFAALNFDFHPAAVWDWLAQTGFVVEKQLAVSHLRQPLLKRVLPLGVLVGLDTLMQRPGGLWPLSPSVFLRARRRGTGQATESLVWRCPACRGLELQEGADQVVCGTCGRVWRTRGGVYDFKTPVSGPPMD